MAVKTEPRVVGNFNWDSPRIVSAFAEGDDSQAIYEKVAETLKGNFGYDDKTKTMWGSSLPLSARVDSIVRPLGIRVATLADLSREEIMSKIRAKFYSDTPALVMRSTVDSYPPNTELIPSLVEHVEKVQGTLRQPILITGFDIVPAENQYGWEITPRDDFNVLEDDRLNGRHNGKKFSEVDESGLPKFDRKGSRTWYARDQGLSRLYLDGDLNLDSDCGNLADSLEIGRVVLVSGEAAGADLEQSYKAKLQEKATARKSELDTWFNESIANMPGGKR